MDQMPPFNANTFVAFNMIAYSLFLLSGVGMWKGWKFPMIIVWFFTIAGVIGNALVHPLLALRVEGYFPGLFTSFAYWVVGPILLLRLTSVGRANRNRPFDAPSKESKGT
jgi:hypothetical protein